MRNYILSFFLVAAGILHSQSASVDCSNPYQSSLDVSKRIKSMLERVKNTQRDYNEKSFKEYEKFDAYIACAKKNQGEDSEDAKKIAELKNEISDIIRTNKSQAKVNNSDSAKSVNNRAEALKIATKNQCPADVYKGKDGATIKSSLKSAWAKDEQCLKDYDVLKVCLTGESWEKAKGYDYSRSADSFKKYDESTLNVAVIFVPKGKPANYKGTEVPEIAYVFYYTLVKDNINGGKIAYSDIACNKLLPDHSNLLSSNSGNYILKSNVK